jgi:hypothetical protein
LDAANRLRSRSCDVHLTHVVTLCHPQEHQEEVDDLLDRTKLEMQATTQAGGPSPRVLSGSTTFQHIKGACESVQNGSYSAAGKCKKRERSDQNLDPSKRERNVKLEDAEASPLKRERSMKPEEIISNLDKDGGLVDVTGVDSLVQLMQQDQNDGSKKVADVTARRTKEAYGYLTNGYRKPIKARQEMPVVRGKETKVWRNCYWVFFGLWTGFL